MFKPLLPTQVKSEVAETSFSACERVSYLVSLATTLGGAPSDWRRDLPCGERSPPLEVQLQPLTAQSTKAVEAKKTQRGTAATSDSQCHSVFSSISVGRLSFFPPDSANASSVQRRKDPPSLANFVFELKKRREGRTKNPLAISRPPAPSRKDKKTLSRQEGQHLHRHSRSTVNFPAIRSH